MLELHLFTLPDYVTVRIQEEKLDYDDCHDLILYINSIRLWQARMYLLNYISGLEHYVTYLK